MPPAHPSLPSRCSPFLLSALLFTLSLAWLLALPVANLSRGGGARPLFVEEHAILQGAVDTSFGGAEVRARRVGARAGCELASWCMRRATSTLRARMPPPHSHLSTPLQLATAARLSDDFASNASSCSSAIAWFAAWAAGAGLEAEVYPEASWGGAAFAGPEATLAVTATARAGGSAAGSEGILLMTHLPASHSVPQRGGGGPSGPHGAFLLAAFAAMVSRSPALGKDVVFAWVCTRTDAVHPRVGPWLDAYHHTSPAGRAQGQWVAGQQPAMVAERLSGGCPAAGENACPVDAACMETAAGECSAAFGASARLSSARSQPLPPLRLHSGPLRGALYLHFGAGGRPPPNGGAVHVQAHGASGALPDLDLVALVTLALHGHGVRVQPCREGGPEALQRLRAALTSVASAFEAGARRPGSRAPRLLAQTPFAAAAEHPQAYVDALVDAVQFAVGIVWPVGGAHLCGAAARAPTRDAGAPPLTPHAELMLRGVPAVSIWSDAGAGAHGAEPGVGAAGVTAARKAHESAASRDVAASAQRYMEAVHQTLRGLLATEERLHSGARFYLIFPMIGAVQWQVRAQGRRRRGRTRSSMHGAGLTRPPLPLCSTPLHLWI